MESRVCDVSVEVVSVKEEPDWEYSEDNEHTAEDEVMAPVMASEDYEQKLIFCTHRIKKEPSCPDDAGSGNECADLYAHHKVKEELVLGPEGVQLPGVPSGDFSETPVAVKEEPSADDGASKDEPHPDPHPDQRQDQSTETPVFGMSPDMVRMLNGSNQAANQNTENNWFSCEQCQKTFMFKSILKRHMKSHQKLDADGRPIDPSKPFYCDKCKKQFSQLLKFTVHLQQHATPLAYTCAICKKEFERHNCLNRHMQQHRNMPHGCDVCKERFVHKVGLIRHKLGHTCVDPTCGVCDTHSNQTMYKRINILRR